MSGQPEGQLQLLAVAIVRVRQVNVGQVTAFRVPKHVLT